MAHVAEIDNIIQPEAKIWNRLVVFFQKVSCQVICEEHSPNRFTALIRTHSLAMKSSVLSLMKTVWCPRPPQRCSAPCAAVSCCRPCSTSCRCLGPAPSHCPCSRQHHLHTHQYSLYLIRKFCHRGLLIPSKQ